MFNTLISKVQTSNIGRGTLSSFYKLDVYKRITNMSQIYRIKTIKLNTSVKVNKRKFKVLKSSGNKEKCSKICMNCEFFNDQKTTISLDYSEKII
jgi:hypothetical protein